MATLQKIRNRAGLLIIVIGVALLAFIIGDGLRSGRSVVQGDRQTVINVDGKKIGYDVYQERLRQMTEAAEAQGMKLSEEDRIRLNNQLAQEFIQDAAIEKIQEETGIKVTGKEFYALISGNGVMQNRSAQQFFQQMGINANDPKAISDFLSQIDSKNIEKLPNEYQQAYARISQNWSNLTSSIINERIMQKYSAIMARSYTLNDIDKKFLASDVSRSVAVVRTPSTAYTNEEVTVSDADISTFYKDHPQFYKLQAPYKLVDYISLQIRPSQKDFADAQGNMLKAKSELAATNEEETVTRNYNEGFAPKFYLSETEIGMLGLAEPLVSFIKSAEVGAVNTPTLANDRYDLIKLVDKKQGPTTVAAQVIVLDSINAKHIDSLVNTINNGTKTFDEMVATYSIDPETKANNGYLTTHNPQTGIAERNLSHSVVSRSGLDTLFKVTPQRAFVMGEGNNKVIMRVAELGEVGNLYKIAYTQVPAIFSDETYRKAHSKLNNLLTKDNSNFDQMAKEAEAEGLSVSRDVAVAASSETLGSIPSSREVVSWALRGKEGDVNDKIFRCGDDYLVIARIGKAIKGDLVPLSEVKEQIKNQLVAEKRGDLFAKNLASKNITSLEGYATAMQSTIDTLANVTIMPNGQMPAEFAGESFATKVGSISAPFRAQTEVMVVKPLAENKAVTTSSQTRDARLEQMRNGVGQSLGYRSFLSIIKGMKITDNRGNFF